MMIAHIDDKKLNNVISSYNETEKVLIEGSDEHLDLILAIKTDLDIITQYTEDLVNQIEKDFNAFNKETATEAVIKIFPVFRIADHIVQRLKNNNVFKGLEPAIEDFSAIVAELKEFVSDLVRYKIEDNDDLTALLNIEK